MDKLEGYDYLHNGCKSLNLTLQVLDGVLCHDGEDLIQSIKPNRQKSWDEFDNEIKNKMNNSRINIYPMTLEGCLVRFVDVIAYLGRDIEDAVAIGLLKTEDFPKTLGQSNRDIVNTLAMDIIANSKGKDEISYSKDCFMACKELYDFNRENIYMNSMIKTQKDKIYEMMETLYKRLLSHVKNQKEDSPIFLDHINFIDRGDNRRSYMKNTPPELIVIDYIAGMTDDYFINVFNELFFPRKLPFNFRQLERLTGLSKQEILEILKEEK